MGLQKLHTTYRRPVKGVWAWSIAIGSHCVADGKERTQALARIEARKAREAYLLGQK